MMHLDGSPGPMIRTFGRRGVFLIMLGLIYVGFGVNLATIPINRFGNPPPGFGLFFESGWWGLLWAIAGTIALLVGLFRARHLDDAVGFIALLSAPAGWTLLYSGSVALALATDGQYGSVRGVSGVLVWSVSWAVVLLVSGWPDADIERRR